MPIVKYDCLLVKMLVCSVCKGPVEKKNFIGQGKTIYSCCECDALVVNVEWAEQEATS